MTRLGGPLAAAFLVAAAMVLGGGPAMAATELRLSPASGPPGTQFVITGTGFAAGEVEIHWGDQSGPILATATGPDFSVTAEVPESAPNSRPVVAVVRNGTAVSTSSASFQVTAGEAPPDTTPTTTTSTTVAGDSATTTTTSAVPASSTTGIDPVTTGGDPAFPASRGSSGVGGGAEDSADAAPGAARPAGGQLSAAGSSPTTSTIPLAAGAGATPTTLTGTPVDSGGSDAGAAAVAAPPGAPVDPAGRPPTDGEVAAPAPPKSTSQSAGAISDPVLLIVGLAMVFGGGVALAIRNRISSS